MSGITIVLLTVLEARCVRTNNGSSAAVHTWCSSLPLDNGVHEWPQPILISKSFPFGDK